MKNENSLVIILKQLADKKIEDYTEDDYETFIRIFDFTNNFAQSNNESITKTKPENSEKLSAMSQALVVLRDLCKKRMYELYDKQKGI